MTKIKKNKITTSERVILIFIIILTFFSLTSFIVLNNKCLFVKNYNPYNIKFDNPENIVFLNTNCGNVIIELYPNISPNAVTRFKTLIKSNSYNNAAFHRVIEDKIVHVLKDDNCEETLSDEASVDVEDLNSDEKIIHVLDEFEDEDTESFDLLENNIEDFNSSDENEEVLDIETPFDMSEDVLNIESPIVDVMDIDVIDQEEIINIPQI